MGRFLIDKSPSQTAASAHWANVDSCGPCGRAKPLTQEGKAQPLTQEGTAKPLTLGQEPRVDPLRRDSYDSEMDQDYSQDSTMKELFDSTMKKTQI